MAIDSELMELSIPDRYLSYAEAYIDAAKSSTEKMCADQSESKWANAAVALMLTAHGVELFLKGAIFKENPSAEVNHHKLEKLYELYRQIYSSKMFDFVMPFSTKYLGMSEDEVETLTFRKSPTPSVLYRYPTATGNKKWEGTYGFNPSTFMPILDQLQNDFSRLKKYITIRG